VANSIGENLRAFLVASTGVTAFVSTGSTGARIHQNIIPQPMIRPAIWFIRSGSFQDVTNAGDGLLTDTNWDLECQDEDIENALDLAEEVKTVLNGHFGTFGSSTTCVKGIFVTDHDDDYIPKGIGEDDDEHIHVAALNVQILI
jgi:hypothetical protein